ncbi:MAG: 50S ribosomal protein L9 [Actinobacteria bacterium]|nr:50S ribosomal protein L9 [Actinomycetota bacterium]
MKVVLKQQVKGLGKAGDIVNVSDGYAQNYLIPRGLATQATTGTLKDLEQKKAAARRREEKELAEAGEIARQLSSKTIALKAKAGEKGHLYGSITSKDIADAVLEQAGLKVDRKKIELPEPIRELGEHKVVARIYPGVEAKFSVSVEEA